MNNSLANVGLALTLAALGLTAVYTINVQRELQQPVPRRIEISTPPVYFTLAAPSELKIPGETQTPEPTLILNPTGTPVPPFYNRSKHFAEGPIPEPELAQKELASNSHSPER